MKPAPMKPDEPRLSLRERKKQRTRECILEAAFTLFETPGYEQTTMDMIAEQAEVSRATLFNYFPSKQSMLLPFAGTLYIRHVEPHIHTYLQTQPPLLDALRFLFLQIQHHILKYPPIRDVLRWELFHSEAPVSPAASHPPFLATLQTMIEVGQQQGEIPLNLPAAALARYVGALYISVLYYVLHHQPEAIYEREIAQLLTFLQGAFALTT